MFATAVIGGLGSISGALLGVLLFRFIETLTFLGDVPGSATSGRCSPAACCSSCCSSCPAASASSCTACATATCVWVADRRGILVPSLVADKRDSSKGAENEVGLLQGALGGGTHGASDARTAVVD